MKKFIVLYHGSMDGWDPSKSSPEDMAKGMEAWMTWAKNCGDKLVDMGTPLGNGVALSPDGKSTNSGKNVMGYSVLQAENLDAAKKLMEGHPHLAWNASCSIEVHECMPMPGR